MNEFLDHFLGSTSYLAIPSFILGAIGMFALKGIVKGDPENNKKFIWFGAPLVAQVLLYTILCISAETILHFRVRNELRAFLSQKTTFQTEINRRRIAEDSSDMITNELKKIHRVLSHHSSPKEEINIQIKSKNETVQLTLRKDSEIDTEYWIFWDKYKFTSQRNFGRISTTLFQITAPDTLKEIKRPESL